MKSLIITIALFFTVCLAYGQQYYPQPELNKFTGTWEYITNRDTFRVELKSEKVVIKNMNMSMDMVEGTYTYIKNGKIIKSGIKYDKPGIYTGGLVDKSKSLTKIRFTFYDVVKEKMGDVIFELLPGKTDEASWLLTNREGIRFSYYDYSFSVPINIFLKRVK